MKKYKSMNGSSSISGSNGSGNTKVNEALAIDSTDDSESYYVEGHVFKTQIKRSELNARSHGNCSFSSFSDSISEHESDDSFDPEGEEFLFEKGANKLSRTDRMRLSGRLAPNDELQSLSEQVRTKKTRKNRLNLSNEELEIRRSETARKRKAQAHMRAEEAKINTIHKLLRKQANNKNILSAGTNNRRTIPTKEPADSPHSPHSLHYVISKAKFILSIPPTQLARASLLLTETVSSQSTEQYPSFKICSVQGCSNRKIYQDPRSGLLSCSYEHYKLLLT